MKEFNFDHVPVGERAGWRVLSADGSHWIGDMPYLALQQNCQHDLKPYHSELPRTFVYPQATEPPAESAYR